MKSKASFLLAALLLFGWSAHAQTSTWKPFVEADLGFGVDFPAVPDKSESTVSSSKIMQMFLTNRGDQRFGVIVNEQKVSLGIGETEIRAAYDNGRDRGLAAFKDAKLLSERDVHLSGVLGREIVFSNYQYFAMARFYVFREKLFQAIVISPKGKETDPSYKRAADKFLDSFHFIDQTEKRQS